MNRKGFSVLVGNKGLATLAGFIISSSLSAGAFARTVYFSKIMSEAPAEGDIKISYNADDVLLMDGGKYWLNGRSLYIKVANLRIEGEPQIYSFLDAASETPRIPAPKPKSGATHGYVRHGRHYDGNNGDPGAPGDKGFKGVRGANAGEIRIMALNASGAGKLSVFNAGQQGGRGGRGGQGGEGGNGIRGMNANSNLVECKREAGQGGLGGDGGIGGAGGDGGDGGSGGTFSYSENLQKFVAQGQVSVAGGAGGEPGDGGPGGAGGYYGTRGSREGLCVGFPEWVPDYGQPGAPGPAGNPGNVGSSAAIVSCSMTGGPLQPC